MWPFSQLTNSACSKTEETNEDQLEPAKPVTYTWAVHYLNGDVERYSGKDYEISDVDIMVRNHELQAVLYVPISQLLKIVLVKNSDV